MRLGSINLKLNDDHTKLIGINKIHAHPDYKTKSKYNDIALMELAHIVYFNEFILPACINIDNDFAWTRAVATGFGLVERGNYALLFYILNAL